MDERYWQTVVPVCHFDGDRLEEVTIYPVSAIEQSAYNAVMDNVMAPPKANLKSIVSLALPRHRNLTCTVDFQRGQALLPGLKWPNSPLLKPRREK